MSERFSFADALGDYVDRTVYTSGQLATLSGLPKSTVVNWLQGRVARPQDWKPLVRLLGVLRVSEEEASQVLCAAGHPPLSELRMLANGDENRLFSPWPLQATNGRPVPFQAIADPVQLVGRDEELRRMEAWLAEGGVCVVQGLPGTGKTTLAARLAYRLRDRFADGVLWARLSRADTLSVLGTFARAYGIDVGDLMDVESRSRVLRDLLAGRQALMVLDDAADSRQIEPLLPPTGRCAVLITTRRRNLRVALAGRQLTLAPFAADGAASRRLFAAFLGAERVEREATALAEIASLVGHLPLALSIAAARLAHEPGWEVDTFLARLRRPDGRQRELAYEDQSVRGSIDVSLDALGEVEKYLFTTLAAFNGADFTTEAAAAAADLNAEDAGDSLRALYALSLAQVTRHDRYVLHPLLHDRAEALAAERGEQAMAAVLKRLAAFYRDFLEQHADEPAEVASEQETIWPVLGKIWQEKEAAALSELAFPFAGWLAERGFLEQACILWRQLLAVVTTEEAQLDCHLGLAQTARRERQYGVAEEHLAAVERLAAGRPALQSMVLAERGTIALGRGDREQAVECFQEGLRLAALTGREELRIPLLSELGAVQAMSGNHAVARQEFDEALRLARCHAPTQVPLLLRHLGALCIRENENYEQARRHCLEGLAHARALGLLIDATHSLIGLTVVESRLGRPDTAERYLDEAAALAEQTGVLKCKALININRANLFVRKGKLAEARACYQRALEIAQLLTYDSLRQIARQGLADVADAEATGVPRPDGAVAIVYE